MIDMNINRNGQIIYNNHLHLESTGELQNVNNCTIWINNYKSNGLTIAKITGDLQSFKVDHIQKIDKFL